MEVTELKREKRYKGTVTSDSVLGLLRKQLKKATSILDIGAGDGRFIKLINERYGKDAVGIDKNPGAEGVLAADISALPFEQDTFDTVICMDVIEHLTDDVLDRGIGEMHRVLKPGGTALVTTIHEEDLEAQACKCPQCGHIFHRIGHVQTFTAKELRERFTKQGFHVHRISTTNLGVRAKRPLVSFFLYTLKLDRIIFTNTLNRDMILVCNKMQG